MEDHFSLCSSLLPYSGRMPSTVAEKPAAELHSEDPVAASSRLMSLDALRGFDMFWIAGADEIVAALTTIAATSAPIAFLHNQLTHRKWEGFVFYDLIFPLFVFIVGVSIVFSLTKAIALRSEERR